MLNKKRLLRQFALPSDQRQAFNAAWRRSHDLFGDSFRLDAHIDSDGIDFVYTHAQPKQEPSLIWGLRIVLSANGRAKVEHSTGVNPPIQTIHRAADMVSQAISHMQANPLITHIKAQKQPKYSKP
jgi:hypothetical protein